jgi:hypothetical protein
MEEDSDFASEIMEKVSNWKENYDRMDMAVAMSNGESSIQAKTALQTGSYLIELDENGDVKNYTVTTNGTGYSSEDCANEKKEENDIFTYEKRALSEINNQESVTTTENINTEPDYIEAMGVLYSGIMRV